MLRCKQQSIGQQAGPATRARSAATLASSGRLLFQKDARESRK